MDRNTCESIFRSEVFNQMNENTFEIGIKVSDVQKCFTFKDDSDMLELCRKYYCRGEQASMMLYNEMLKRFNFQKFYELAESKRISENSMLVDDVINNVKQTQQTMLSNKLKAALALDNN